MKRDLAALFVTGLGLACLPGVSFSGQNSNSKILLHLTAPTTKNVCGVNRIPTCAGVVTNGSLYPALYYAYLLVADGNAPAGVGGLQCGIVYPGGVGGGYPNINVFSWLTCATLEFPSTGWPGPGGGNLITWDTASKCQRYEPGGAGTGVFAVAGYFYVSAYAPGEMAVTIRPVDAKAKVADCSSIEDLIGTPGNNSHLGSAVFSPSGVLYGYNPCGENPQIYCHVLGPSDVAAGQAGIVYTVNPGEITPTGHWLASGNVVVDQSDNTSATVHATGPGTFSIGYQVGTGCVEGCGCGLDVTVHAPTAVEGSSWSRIKAMYPGSR